MKRTFSAFVLAVGLAASFGAHAGFYDGNDLKRWSDANDRSSQTNAKGVDFQAGARFSGYVTGVVDTVDGLLSCPPVGVTVGQLTAVVKQYLDANPAKWNQPGSGLVIEALGNAFPCKKK